MPDLPQANRFTHSSSINTSLGSEEQHPLNTFHKSHPFMEKPSLGESFDFTLISNGLSDFENLSQETSTLNHLELTTNISL